MRKNLGRVVLVALGTLSGTAHAQSAQMQHAAPAATTAVSPTAKESEVVWLRRRVEQLEGQLATGVSGCSSDAKSKMKRKKDNSMPSGAMGDDDKMGGGAMGSMPTNEHSMGKMKPKKDTSMPQGSMDDDKMGDGHM